MPIPKAKVFISHSMSDRAWVEQFVTILKNYGVEAWSNTEILPGEVWVERIEEALRASSTIVLLVNNQNLNSPWMFFELGVAVAGQKRVIPVIIGDVDATKLPPPLALVQGIRALTPAEAAEQVAKMI